MQTKYGGRSCTAEEVVQRNKLYSGRSSTAEEVVQRYTLYSGISCTAEEVVQRNNQNQRQKYMNSILTKSVYKVTMQILWIR